jgi:hypothetical protein
MRSIWLLTALLLACAARAEDFEFFENRIRPVLVDHCYKCHSAGSEKVKGGLLLDTKAGLLKGGETGPAIVPDEPEKSLLIKAVRYTDKDLQMPPKNQRLADHEIADLVAWVQMGAPDPRVAPEQSPAATAPTPTPSYDFAAARKQWAFQKPADPAVPPVKNKHWAKSPIDHFILSKLEEKNLSPAPPADKRMLIRRATFDLTGLPPTPAEVEDFLKDKSAGAFAKVVDRLLASPHYGERWGRHWLDVVRYTDSLDARGVGGEGDSSEAYRYRDWVVNAFNQDMPYNQFVREQIAGDLLQPKEPDRIDTNGIIATGMYAIGNWGNGDADKDKILTDIADDQVDVTGRAFLGLTLACARCHDHKFDPIPTADYYSLAGIFFSSHILPKLTPKGQGEALLFIPLASKGDLDRRQKREERMAELEKQIASSTDQQLTLLGKTMLSQSADYLAAVAAFQNLRVKQPQLSVADFAAGRRGSFQPSPELLQQWVDYLGFGEVKLLSRMTHEASGKPGLHVLHNANDADTPAGFVNSTDQPISFVTITMPAHSVGVHPSPKAGVAAGWKSPFTGTIEIKGRVADADPNCGDGIAWKLEVRRERGTTELASGDIPNGGAQDFSAGTGAANLKSFKINAGETLSLVVLPKENYYCDATVVELELTDRDDAKRVWNLSKDVIAGVNDAKNPYPDSQGHPAVWSIYDMDGQSSAGEVAAGSPLSKWFEAVNRQASKAEVEAASQEIQRALLAPDATNSPVNKLYQDLAAPRSAFWAGSANVEKNFPMQARQALEAQRSELSSLKANVPPPLARAHGLQEGGVPESPHAGMHDVKVHLRGRYDRLGDLAPRRFPRVLAGDGQKPITQGSGRLELADWIASPDNPLTARVMVNRIWQHHFGEGIVRTPNNYGKLGVPPTHPELLDYLAHRFVESGWSVKAMHRAIMLSAAYQQSSIPLPATFKDDPDNLLFGRMNRRRLESEPLRDSLLDAAGKLDLTMGGPSIRDLNSLRRTLYVMTIRSDRATYQFLFDAADPNAIVEKRIDSTVAPQALFLLNNPFVLAQIKGLAQRVLKEAPDDDAKRVQWLYELLYARPAGQQELQLGLSALSQSRTETKDNEAAWEQYCQVLLCANEFVYVD